MSFHFTKETPHEELFADFGILNALDDELYAQLLDILYSFAMKPAGVDLAEDLASFCQSSRLKISVAKSAARGLLFYLKAALKSNLKPAFVYEDTKNLGLSEEKAIMMGKKWKDSLVGLSRANIAQTLMVNQLVDMDWRFGVTASTSELSAVGSTFLQLHLVLDKGGNEREDVYMELTLPQFYHFLHEMEKAKANLDLF
eukprot:TRINITY_DN7553_c0_g1_i1.p1 TRINITY_DN7553_c0_g1~~TRINITY_DN7553_c0_g1_i1.p1  ORF type:complete len:199 (+),score=53.09 TRINITY_DN7553_c0_g1_i1:56-652(+)